MPSLTEPISKPAFGFLLALLFSAPLTAFASKKPAPIDFSAQIRPIISANCYHCHGPDDGSRKAKLRLDLREDAVRERKGGHFVIKPGATDQSELIRRITSTDPGEVMPPPEIGHALKPEQIDVLKQWIQQGAPYAEHWAFQKPVRPALPKVKNTRWAKTHVDRFILSKLEEHKLKPSPQADRHALIRRVSLDLTGLPPTPSEVEQFVKDKSPDAFEKVVDRLLASPAFGEKWARSWLDIARYADSAGYGSDPLRLNIWPYRDWVINALNANMPFDQFTLEQLAGDLLEKPTTNQLVATAFHRNTMTNTEGGTDDEEWRVAAVKDRVNVTVQAWMGLTMGCAQCHTHKFDPITQTEYYQFYAFFNQTEDEDKPDERPTLPIGEGDPETIKALEEKIAELEKAKGPEAKKGLRKAKAELEQAKLAVPIMRELPHDKQRVTRLMNKGNFLDLGDSVAPGVPAALHSWPEGAPTNRIGVARWLMSPDNPLTARVAVNRIWAELFGVGLVETVEDFGTQGTLPSHPELLDWLAMEFMAPLEPVQPLNRYKVKSVRSASNLSTIKQFNELLRPWDQKRLIKLMVLSATYQQSARVTPQLLEKDPRNRLLARAPRPRLDAEMVRDQSLAASGLLSGKIGGPSVYPPQPEGLWRAAFNGQRAYDTSTGEDRYRRGLYTIWRRTVPYPSMATFDAPSRENCTFRRQPTNTPLQAYVTLNDPVYVEAAQALGRRIIKEGGNSIDEKIKFGLELALARPARKQDIAELRKLFETELAHYRAQESEALKLATEPLGSLPEGLSAAEAAAWTVVANVLLNLDGVLTKG